MKYEGKFSLSLVLNLLNCDFIVLLIFNSLNELFIFL